MMVIAVLGLIFVGITAWIAEIVAARAQKKVAAK
jgi:hypothetical protein